MIMQETRVNLDESVKAQIIALRVTWLTLVLIDEEKARIYIELAYQKELEAGLRKLSVDNKSKIWIAGNDLWTEIDQTARDIYRQSRDYHRNQ